ncbi:FAD-dependent oxidoreductase [Ferrimicrobium sp.]|uniref:FAD-dependent oxidoreductase n=1 Tax=Ferrimicrobium sp. TaxID=2926050 RepID=UPI002612A90B|nr:FAD-dependent oxidoreductase [Ferrimicrobium sp.]
MRLVIVGGSDAGIAAALRARELEPSNEVTVVLDDEYPNFSVCGIPYYLSGEVREWSNLAHRSHRELLDQGINLRTDTHAVEINPHQHELICQGSDRGFVHLPWDRLIIATGARPIKPPIEGLVEALKGDRVFLVHTIADARAIMKVLDQKRIHRALVIGAGYIGLELAEALSARGIKVNQYEARDHVLPTISSDLAGQLELVLTGHGVELATDTVVTAVATDDRQVTLATSSPSSGVTHVTGDLAIVVAGVRPSVDLALTAGVKLGYGGAVWVNRQMATGVQDIYAAGDCVITHHQLLGESYLPLGTTAHKQGRVAGAVAIGHDKAEFQGVVGTQVVKVFDQVIARTGLTDDEATSVNFNPVSTTTRADDHKRYYPGAETLTIRLTADASTHRLLGVAMLGPISSGAHKRIDTAAVALRQGITVEGLMDLDLAYTPPLGTPWDAMQVAASQWLFESSTERRYYEDKAL